jgi:uncharacterized UPF0160 family protein
MNKIITHSGIFHADEVFAVATIRKFFGRVPVIRTRDADIIRDAQLFDSGVVVDVGSYYDPQMGCFDHHQKNFTCKRENGIPFSSFGLVWNWYAGMFMPESVCDLVDQWLVQKIDAVDCGVAEKTSEYTVSHIISSFNPCAGEECDADEQFMQAVTVATQTLNRVIVRAVAEEYNASYIRSVVAEQQGDRVLVLDKFCPWQKIVINEAPEVLFVVFPDVSGTWRIQAVPDAEGSFGMRKALPEEWVEGKPMEDFIFCHKNLFIAGCDTKESAIILADVAAVGF